MAQFVIATDQESDRLIYQGEEYEIVNGSPISDLLGEESPYLFRPNFSTTALWRGVVAQWCISDDQLFLVQVSGYRDERPVRVSEFVEDESGFAKWFSGKLELSAGAYLETIGGVTYEYHPVAFEITIRNGRVIRVNENQNRPKEEPFIKIGYEKLVQMLEEQVADMRDNIR